MKWGTRILITAALVFAPAVLALTPPPASYNVQVRVVSAIDDSLDGISYQRVQLNVLSAIAQADNVSTAPMLGAGTTITAIVRDPAAQAILRSVNTSTTIGMKIGWFAESTYEVLSVDQQPAIANGATVPGSSTDSQLYVFLGVALAAGLFLVLLRLYHHNV